MNISFCYDTVILYVQEHGNLDVFAPELEEEIHRHPLIIKELNKKKEDTVLNNKILVELRNSVKGKSIIL